MASCLVRIVWMAAGNAALLMLAATIMQEPPWTLTAKDGAFWSVVVAVVALRWADVAWLAGRTADGRPATRRDVARHAVVLAGVAALLWMIVQSVRVA